MCIGDPIFALPSTQVYLDIEGLPDRGIYYLIGVLIVTGGSQQYHYFWADDESGQVTIFKQLAALLTAITDWRLFHYGNYEVKAIRRMLSRVPESCRETLRTILAHNTNILSIVSSHVYFPTTFNSLKEVAGFLGFRWASVEASGLGSMIWREQWEDSARRGAEGETSGIQSRRLLGATYRDRIHRVDHDLWNGTAF